MNMLLRDQFRYIFLLLVPAVTWLFMNAAVNRHDHYMSDGYVISHAHPYEKTPADPLQSHQHSGTELFLLSLICDPFATTSVIFVLVLFLLAVMQLFRYLYDVSVPIRSLYQVRNYHAPPGN
jgi:hypothetical protein